MNYQQIIKQFYQSYKATDKETFRETLTADLTHLRDFATYTNRYEIYKPKPLTKLSVHLRTTVCKNVQ